MSTPTGASGHDDNDEQASFSEVIARFTLTDNRKRDTTESQGTTLESATDDPDNSDEPDDEDPPPLQHDGYPEEVSASGVRAYTWTGGRTRARTELELQTLISTTLSFTPSTGGSAIDDHGKPEYRAIMEMCQTPRSVAEIAALNDVPIGVARVLLSDMLELGLVVTHHVVVDDGSAPHLEMMERILSGLRRL